ncbi:MAG: ribonuclease HII [Anaerolinea sp.]|nr:ribonuclease HII [Anaerolinea sp.]
MRSRFDPSEIPQAPNLSFERDLWSNTIQYVAGIDEAGRGAWAGPVYAAAVIFPNDPNIEIYLAGVQDSKQVSPQKRTQLAVIIRQFALAWAVAYADAREIDELGILPANRLAMMRAVNALTIPPEHLLIDAMFLSDMDLGQTSLIKGDQRSLSIAAASILAKTERDAWMIAAHDQYPAYRFDLHKGYGTKTHQQGLARDGICDLHRKSYKPIINLINT